MAETTRPFYRRPTVYVWISLLWFLIGTVRAVSILEQRPADSTAGVVLAAAAFLIGIINLGVWRRRRAIENRELLAKQ